MLKNSIDLPLNSRESISYQYGLPIHRQTSFIVTEKTDKQPGINKNCKQLIINSPHLITFYLPTGNRVLWRLSV